MSRWAWLATLAIGCGHPTAPASPGSSGGVTPTADAAVDGPLALEEDPPRLAVRAVRLFADWQRALAESGDSCATAADKMNALADANKDLIDANARLLRAPRDKVLAVRAELEKRDAEMAPAAKAISESALMAKCTGHLPFARAVDRLAGEG
jgi:hypothetical protein